MPSKMESPAGRRGNPVVSLASGKIDPESTDTRPLSQAAAKRLARIVFKTPPKGTIALIGNNGLPYWRPE
jgi:hypothetical protein